jgi:tetratricopeptide (TPR) repeat protein
MKADLRTGTLLVVALMAIAPGSPSQDLEHRIRQLDAEARTEERQGHPEVAIQKYQEIIKLDPKLPVVYNQLGRLYYQQGRFQDAVAPLKRAAELAPQARSSQGPAGTMPLSDG